MFDFFLDSGGIPIVVDQQMIGAVGVSGVDGGRDENCAIEGLKAAFVRPRNAAGLRFRRGRQRPRARARTALNAA
jgi:uncharacterized protein (UPF0303 family)